MSASLSISASGAERQGRALARHVVMLAAAGQRRWPASSAPLSNTHTVLRGIAPELHRDDREQGRFAGAGRAEHQRVADIADMQVEPKRRGAGGRRVQQRRRARRVEWARIDGVAGPHAGQRHEVGEVEGVDQRPADVAASGGRASEPSQASIALTVSSRQAETQPLDLAGHGARTLEQLAPGPPPSARSPGCRSRRSPARCWRPVIAASVSPAISRASSLTMPPWVCEHLGPEAADLLPPLAPVLPELRDRLVGIEVDHPGRPAIGHRQMLEDLQDVRVALVRKALDRDAGEIALADARRIAGPQFLSADDGIEVHAVGRQVQRRVVAGQEKCR